jgi:hypothetical protein
MKQAALCFLLAWVLVAIAELGWPGFFLLDDVRAHYMPGLNEVGQAWRQGEVPLISRYTWCAGGLAGEYQYGIFNPLVQLVAVAITLVSSLATRAAIMVAFFGGIATWGATRLGRELGMKPPVALALAGIFCLNRYTLDMGWREWLPMGVAFSFFPWFWLSLVQKRLSIPLLVASLGLTLSSGWPFTVAAAAILGLFYFGLALWQGQWRRAAMLAAAGVCGLALSSGSLGLLLEYSQSAVRSQRPSWQYRLEPWHALTYLLPGLSFWSPTEENSSLYTSIGWIPCLGILGFWLERLAGGRFGRVPDAKSLFPLWWLALVWFALGMAPSVGGMRFSIRWLNFLNPLMGLLGLQWLSRQANNSRHRFGIATWAAILLGQVLGIALDDWREHTHQWLPGPVLLLIAFGWAWNSRPRQRHGLLALAVWLGLLLATPLTPLGYHQYPEATIVNTLVKPDRCWLSLYSYEELLDSRAELVRPARFANSGVLEHLPMVNGYSPLYAAPIVRAWTFSMVGSLQPNPGYVNNIALGATSGGLMDKLGINGLLLSPQWQPLESLLLQNQWRLLGHEGLVHVWVRDRAPQPVFEPLTQAQYCIRGAETAAAALEPNGPPVIRSATQAPGIRQFVPLQCEPVASWRNGASCHVSANTGNQAALIAVHRPWFQGYRAFLNGRELTLSTLNLQHMAVEIPAGSAAGILEVVYQPHALKIGLVLGLIGLCGMVLLSKLNQTVHH